MPGDQSAFMAMHGVDEVQVELLICNKEHLKARCEGGQNEVHNIATAHVYRNRLRHQQYDGISAKSYRKLVRTRMWVGGWFPLPVPASLKPRIRVHVGNASTSIAAAHQSTC